MKKLGAAVLAGAIIAGCAPEQKPDETAVSVNGVKLMKSQVDADVEAIVKAQGDKIPADQMEYAKQMIANQVAQGFIYENVLVAKAKSEGYAVTDADRKAREAEFLKAVAKMPDAPKSVDDYFKKFPLGEKRAREQFENGILIDKMIKDHRAKAPKKDHAAEARKIIANVISNNAATASSAADSEKKIKALKAQLDKVPAGELAAKFAELAKANSACPSSAKGGDLGEFTHGQMVKEFDDVAFKMPVGKVSDPVKTQFGWHLVMVTKKTPAVEAKGDKPAEPEKVQASHILIKSAQTQEVPKEADVINFLSKQDERTFMKEFMDAELGKAKIEASEQFKQLLPAKPEAKAAPAVKNTPAKTAPVDKPAGK